MKQKPLFHRSQFSANGRKQKRIPNLAISDFQLAIGNS
jgi:hypothetical protein